MQPDITLPKDIKVKVYTALLTQTGTNAPTALVLQNTTRLTITWARTNTGDYSGTLSENIDQTKTIITGDINGLAGWDYGIRFVTPGDIQITTKASGSPNDGLLLKSLFEIKIYQ